MNKWFDEEKEELKQEIQNQKQEIKELKDYIKSNKKLICLRKECKLRDKVLI